MTNELLIKRLRNCGKASPDRCWDCEYYDREPWCESALVTAAAAALEAAEHRIEDLEGALAACRMRKDVRIPKEGEWIDAEHDEYDLEFGRHQYFCSVCGKFADSFVGGSEEWWCRRKPNYCPNCGARMKTVTDCHTLEEGER